MVADQIAGWDVVSFVLKRSIGMLFCVNFFPYLHLDGTPQRFVTDYDGSDRLLQYQGLNFHSYLDRGSSD